MTEKTMSNWRYFLGFGLAAALFAGDVTFEAAAPLDVRIGFATPAEARIGRPLTPLSYAGVARRTTRRVVRRNVNRLAVLPGGCIYGPYYGSYYYRCGGYYYARQGGVYVQVIVQ
jgi:hypothetical protein